MTVGVPTAKTVCFLACHPNGGNHLSDYYTSLSQGYSAAFIGVDKGFETAERKKISPIKRLDTEKPLSEMSNEEQKKLARSTAKKVIQVATHLIADVGSPFTKYVFKELKALESKVIKMAYHDNHEPFVPGGYTELAIQTFAHADHAVYANKTMAEDNGFGIGYFDFSKVDTYRLFRSTQIQATKRKNLFNSFGIADKGQKLMVYLGGANKVYSEQAFPAFAKLLRESAEKGVLDHAVVMLQRHPRASNEDKEAFEALQKDFPKLTFAVSPLDFDSSLAVADLVCYYQTSASLFLPLAGIPAFQVGHEPFDDTPYRHGLLKFASTVENLQGELESATERNVMPTAARLKELYELMGVDKNWGHNLYAIMAKV